MGERVLFLLFAFAALVISFSLLLTADPDAHYIVGYVHNAKDCTSPNGMKVIAHQAGNPLDNVTDIIGPLGNSGTNNEYLIDCQLFQNSCRVNDLVVIEVPYQIDHSAGPVNVSITPSGFDIAPNMTLRRHYRVDIPTPCE